MKNNQIIKQAKKDAYDAAFTLDEYQASDLLSTIEEIEELLKAMKQKKLYHVKDFNQLTTIKLILEENLKQ